MDFSKYLNNRSINPYIFDKIMSNEIFGQDSSSVNSFSRRHGIDYELNNYGYRSDDFFENNESVLFSGCSFGYGMGLPKDYSWPAQLNSFLGHDKIANLSLPGNSSARIIYEVMRYIDKFGKPSAIAIMFPNYQRYHRVQLKKETILEVVPFLLHRPDPTHNIDTEEKNDMVQYIFNKETLLYDFFNNVKIFEKCINSMGIPMIWSTWAPGLSVMLRESDFDNYFRLGPMDDFLSDHMDDCLPHEKEYWLDASDKPYPHPGILEQRFYAKEFEKKIMSDEKLKAVFLNSAE